MVPSLLMLYSGGAGEICTHVFRHIWYSLNTLLVWGGEYCHGFALLVHLDDAHPSIPCSNPAPKQGWDLWSSQVLPTSWLGRRNHPQKTKTKTHTKKKDFCPQRNSSTLKYGLVQISPRSQNYLWIILVSWRQRMWVNTKYVTNMALNKT